MNNTVTTLAEHLVGNARPVAGPLLLDTGEFVMALASNSHQLLDVLRRYFAHLVIEEGPADVDILAIERDPPDPGLSFRDWPREAGKTGRKDSYIDLEGARLLRKVRTGMVFLQGAQQCIAAGPCLANDNQLINFINSQYMTWLQHRDWLICHASALVGSRGALALAGFSGGGKSTLMLHLLDQPGLRYLTNDRLFLKREAGGIVARGIPKLPRVNPGTIVHNPRLHRLLPPAAQAELLAMPRDTLWDLEEKHDVMVEEVYGPDRIASSAPMAGLLVLNWHRDDPGATRIERVDLEQRRELLGAVMKSPGPFYQHPDGSFLDEGATLAEQPYLDTLAEVPVYEASGVTDFEAAIDWARRDLLA